MALFSNRILLLTLVFSMLEAYAVSPGPITAADDLFCNPAGLPSNCFKALDATEFHPIEFIRPGYQAPSPGYQPITFEKPDDVKVRVMNELMENYSYFALTRIGFDSRGSFILEAAFDLGDGIRGVAGTKRQYVNCSGHLQKSRYGQSYGILRECHDKFMGQREERQLAMEALKVLRNYIDEARKRVRDDDDKRAGYLMEIFNDWLENHYSVLTTVATSK